MSGTFLCQYVSIRDDLTVSLLIDLCVQRASLIRLLSSVGASLSAFDGQQQRSQLSSLLRHHAKIHKPKGAQVSVLIDEWHYLAYWYDIESESLQATKHQ